MRTDRGAMRHPGGGIICNGAGLDATTMFMRSHAAWVGKEVTLIVTLSYVVGSPHLVHW